MNPTLLQSIKEKYAALEHALQSPEVTANSRLLQQTSIEYNELKEVVRCIERHDSLQQAIADARQTIEHDSDGEMITLAKEELVRLEAEQARVNHELQLFLLPKDPNDAKNTIIEIRAGAGGDESALFAAELFRAYTRFAEKKGWKAELISANRTGIGGYKEVICEVRGHGAYSEFKYEMGVHRVQRVPETEKSGRVHTSTVTVAVMPEAEEIDLEILPGDLRIDVFRSGGHGGQSVNTTDSAVRITHLSTGMVVSCQDEKSQHKNKDKAMKILRSRLMVQMEEAERQKRGDARRLQIGTGDRSEKIRTYNVPQDRITDHRIKESWNNIGNVMEGNLEPLIAALKEADKLKQLEKLQRSNTSA